MPLNALTFESDIRSLVAHDDIEGALAFIRFLVDHVRFDPAATGLTLGSPALDRLCGEIGALTLPQARLMAKGQAAGHQADVIILATELYALGGHSRVIADLIATRPDKRHLLLLSNFFDAGNNDIAVEMATDNVQVEIAPTTSRLDKLLWLQSALACQPQAQVFVFNHHGDAATIAAIQPDLNREVIFCHHADYHLCLGAHLPWTRHVDFFAPCHHRCSEAGIVAEYWPLSVPDRGARAHAAGSFGHGATLTTCTSGVWSKFDEVYPFHYADVLADIMRVTGGCHLHIGGIPEAALARIHAGLAAQHIPSERFHHLPHVPSVWDALIAQRIDLYISSFPLGGGRAITEALGAGIPLITHRHHLDPLLGSSGLGPADTWNWSVPSELLDILSRLTPAELARRSRDSRQHYLDHHGPEVFSACVTHGKSAPLPAHTPPAGDRLLSYLLRSAVRQESHAPVIEELHKRVQAVSAAQPRTGFSVSGSFADAVSLYDSGDIERAGEAFAKLHEGQPSEPQTLVYLGLVALQTGLPEDAKVFLQHAVTSSQDPVNTQAAIGQRCLELGQAALAATYLEAATRNDPKLIGAWALLADALHQQGKTRAALDSLKPLVLKTDAHAEILLRAMRLAAVMGDTDTELAASLRLRQYADCHSRALQLMAQRDEVATSALRDETRRFVAMHANAPRSNLVAGACARLRVGFVVGRIAANAVAQRLEPLLCELDPACFETLLFFDEIHDVTTAQRLGLVVDESHAIAGMDAATAAALIQSRRCDILINLEWYEHLPALMVFSQRAAPLQINFSQPARSSELANMDYVLADAADAPDFSERVLPFSESADAAHYARRFGETLVQAWQQRGGRLEAGK